MVVNMFLVYIGIFFACTVVSVVLVKNFVQGFAEGGKKPLFEGGFSGIFAAGGAYLAVMFTSHLFAVFWIFAGIFFLLGIIHVSFFHKKYFSSDKESKTKRLIGELLFMLALLLFIVVVFSSLAYFLKNRNFLFLPMMMSMLAFFIPLAVYHTFEAAYKIPATQFPSWVYPVDDPIELPEEWKDEKILVIAFELSKKEEDKVRTHFRAKGPETMILGELYYHFINNYNEVNSETPIQFVNKDGYPFKTGFRRKVSWYQFQQILDPVLSLRENKIKENTVIICERI